MRRKDRTNKMAGFIPKFYTDGAVDPWVHAPAAVGEYHIGMALVQTSGNLTQASGATKPTHICMAERKITSVGDILAAIPVDASTEFEVVLTAAVSGLTAGSTANISTDGMSIVAGESGVFRVVSASGAAIGDTAVGRFA